MSAAQVKHALVELRAQLSPIARYLYLRRLQLEAPPTFYSLLSACTQEILPDVYTPTVGEVRASAAAVCVRRSRGDLTHPALAGVSALP